MSENFLNNDILKKIIKDNEEEKPDNENEDEDEDEIYDFDFDINKILIFDDDGMFPWEDEKEKIKKILFDLSLLKKMNYI